MVQTTRSSRRIPRAACLATMLAIAPGAMVRSQMEGNSEREQRNYDDAAAVAYVEQQVRGATPHPGALEFRDVRFFGATGAGCGSLNAATQGGGSTGFLRFVVLKDGSVWYEPARAPKQLKAFELLAQTACKDAISVDGAMARAVVKDPLDSGA